MYCNKFTTTTINLLEILSSPQDGCMRIKINKACEEKTRTQTGYTAALTPFQFRFRARDKVRYRRARWDFYFPRMDEKSGQSRRRSRFK